MTKKNNPCDTIEQDEQNEEVGVEQLFNSFCLVGKITTLHADQIKEQLKEFENIILKERTEEIKKELNDMSYNGVLESNEKRRGYDIAITEFLEFLNKLD